MPGRKSDVSDCQWIQYLHSVGLLRASFRPPDAICAIRTLWRHRGSLLEMGRLESVQDEEDLENSTIDKIRRVMHLVYSTAQANDLIPRTQEANPVTHVHIATLTEYEAILVTPQQAWNIIFRIQAFARLLTLLVAVTGLRIGEVLALRWKHDDWGQFRIRVVSNFVRGKFGEPKSAASKKPVVLHPLVMGLLKNWRDRTVYAGDEDFIFASARLKGKAPRVPNMLVEDHLRPAAKQVIEIPDGHRFGFHNLRHALASFLVEIGTDSKTIQETCCVGQTLQSCSRSMLTRAWTSAWRPRQR